MSEARNVVEALAHVMGELPGIGKDQKADPKQGGYSYRGIESITREAQKLFAKEGIVFTPHVVGIPEVVDIIVNDRPWTDTRMLVQYMVHHGPSDTALTVGPIFAIGRDNSDKGANKCLTQAFKYALLQTLCISDASDDTDGQHHEADRTSGRGRATPAADSTPRPPSPSTNGDSVPAHVDNDPASLDNRAVTMALAKLGQKTNGTIEEKRARLKAAQGASRGHVEVPESSPVHVEPETPPLACSLCGAVGDDVEVWNGSGAEYGKPFCSGDKPF